MYFYRNYATMNGGAVSFATEDGIANFSRNISRRNLAGGVGGAFSFATTIGDLNIFNNTSYADSADDGGSIYIYLDQPTANSNYYNNILRLCSLPAFAGSGAAAVSARYSNIQGGSGEDWFGTGCIDTDPLFIDAFSGNFRLGWANSPIADATKSPCIDTGDPASALDLDGTRADMGAIVYNQATYIDGEIARPKSFVISAYPNPFNSAVKFTIDGAGELNSPLSMKGCQKSSYFFLLFSFYQEPTIYSRLRSRCYRILRTIFFDLGSPIYKPGATETKSIQPAIGALGPTL